jgi:integrase
LTRYPGVYAYCTREGTRSYWFIYRRADGSQSSKRGFSSPRAANEARSEMLINVRRGLVVPSRGTFEDFWTKWLEARKGRVEDGTHADYARHGRLRIVPAFGAMKLARIEPDHIEHWLSELMDTGLAPKTINNSLTTLASCLKSAVERGLIPRNPASLVERLPDAHREMDYLRLDEIPRYLDHVPPEYEVVAEVLIETGMRIGEALALTWADIDLRSGAIRIERTVKFDGRIGATKGKRARSVNLSRGLADTLRRYEARRGMRASSDYSRQLAFTKPSGARLDRSWIRSRMHLPALEGAGLRPLRVHDLRHTAAALCSSRAPR